MVGGNKLGLLEKLASEEPYKYHRPPKGPRYPDIFTAVRRHYDEIETVRKRGYSWGQIIHKAFDAWEENGELKPQYCSRPSIVYNYYNRVKRERTGKHD